MAGTMINEDAPGVVDEEVKKPLPRTIRVQTQILNTSVVPSGMHSIEMAINPDDEDLSQIEKHIQEYCITVGKQLVQCYRGMDAVEVEEAKDGDDASTVGQDTVSGSGATEEAPKTGE